MEFVKDYFRDAQALIGKVLENPGFIQSIEKAAGLMTQSLQNGNKLISCGNGGSMADAMHFAEELSGKFNQDRPALAAISISDPTHISCTANDYGYESIFSRYLQALGKRGDLLLAISTSGNSPNILEAAKYANSAGITVIGLTGKGGGALSSLCDVEIKVAETPHTHHIQEIHIKVIHILISLIEKQLGY
jgi:D-sedoheptulose 7-phosphate isomerase